MNEKVKHLKPGQFSISDENVKILAPSKFKFSGTKKKTLTITIQFEPNEINAADTASPITKSTECGVFDGGVFTGSDAALRVGFDNQDYVSLLLNLKVPVKKGEYGN
jgi:hypothetical protein